MNEDTTQPNIPRDYSVEITDHPERILGCSVFWGVLVSVILGFALGLAFFMRMQ